MTQSFLYRMPAGIPGDINRAQHATVMPEIITPFGTTGAPAAYGLGVVIDATSGQIRTVAAADTLIHGFLARPYPTNSSQSGIGVSVPPTSGACDLLRRGFMTVLLGGATAAFNGAPVYIWSAVSAGLHVTGQVEVTNPAGSGFAVAGAFFTGAADANGNVEISYLP